MSAPASKQEAMHEQVDAIAGLRQAFDSGRAAPSRWRRRQSAMDHRLFDRKGKRVEPAGSKMKFSDLSFGAHARGARCAAGAVGHLAGAPAHAGRNDRARTDRHSTGAASRRFLKNSLLSMDCGVYRQGLWGQNYS